MYLKTPQRCYILPKSPICCVAFACIPPRSAALLDDKGIPYEYVDITESTKNLRAFLAMRDTLPVYDEAKAEGRIGIPSFVWEDGSVTLDTDWLSAGGACTDC